MPVIVYKTMSLRVDWAQVRRIACAHCRADYWYVAGGYRMSQSTGLPLLSDSDAMRESVGKSIERQLEKVAKAARLGAARCPGCRREQPWMVWQTAKALLAPAFIGCIVAVMASLVLTALVLRKAEFVPTFLGVSILVWAVFVGITWWWRFGRFAARPDGDPRSMSPSAFEAFLAECDANQEDPALAWYWRKVRRKLPGEGVHVVSLGVADMTGPARGR